MYNDFFPALAIENFDGLCAMIDIETYELLFINKKGSEYLGVDPTKISGKKCYEILECESKVCDSCQNKKLEHGKYHVWEAYDKNKNSWYEFRDIIIDISGRKVKLRFSTDITDKKNIDTKLQSQLKKDQTLIKCAQTLSENSNVDIAINELLSIMCDFYKAERSYIIEFNKDKLFLDNTYEWCSTDIIPQIDNLQDIPIEVAQTWFDKFEETGDFFITSLDKDVDVNSKTYQILKDQGINSLLAAPLKKNNEFFGFLGVDNPHANFLDSEVLRTVSLFIIDDLEKKKLLEKLEKYSFFDGLTNTYNRRKYTYTVDYIKRNKINSIGIVYLDINGLKLLNDEHGHEYGDTMIIKAVDLIKLFFSDNIFRTGGDEFICLYMEKDMVKFLEKVQALRNAINLQTDLSLSMGSTWCSESEYISQQIICADELMYIDKQNHYKTNKNPNK